MQINILIFSTRWFNFKSMKWQFLNISTAIGFLIIRNRCSWIDWHDVCQFYNSVLKFSGLGYERTTMTLGSVHKALRGHRTPLTSTISHNWNLNRFWLGFAFTSIQNASEQCLNLQNFLHWRHNLRKRWIWAMQYRSSRVSVL